MFSKNVQSLVCPVVFPPHGPKKQGKILYKNFKQQVIDNR